MSDTTDKNESAIAPDKAPDQEETAHSSQGAAEGDAKDQSPPPEGISSELPSTG